MYRSIASIIFVSIILVLQLSPTSAGSSAIIARIKNRNASIVVESTAAVNSAANANSGSGTSSRNLKLDKHNKQATSVQNDIKQFNLRPSIKRKLDHEPSYESKMNYQSYQPKSTMSKEQKVGLFSVLSLTLVLAIYSCVLRYELSTLNVYSLLGIHTSTEEDDEAKVGNAYGNKVEMI